ncbi:uncharacterized protein DFL_000031 [Arthrobotrys flagrans]|uniref:Uncharacterized protein n=1 Tax=Arthrobotrys flagrans TaxID=97331 RepID=A0A437ADY4_ARTFL|nr:hypothetical protein DFL_000031 [Arthrobotrys flagrans]
MAEFLVSLNPANWPQSIPLHHTLLLENDSFRHIHIHEVNIHVSDNVLKLVRELRRWAVFGSIGFVVWKGWKWFSKKKKI